MVTGMMPREPRWEYRSGRSRDPADVGGLVQDEDHGRVEPPAGLLGVAPPGAHHHVGQRGDQRGRRRPGLGDQVQGVAAAGEPGRVERRQVLAARRGDPGHDLLVVQALRRGAGGLVDPVPGLGGAVLRAAQAGGQRAEPGVGEQLGGGRGGRRRPATGRHSRSVRPEDAAARNRRAQQVLGGRPPDVASGVVVDGQDEVGGQPVRRLDVVPARRAGSTTSAGRSR